MDVFGSAEGEGGAFLHAAAIDAAHELGVFAVLAVGTATLDELATRLDLGAGRRRLRPLLDVLVAIGALVRDGDRHAAATVPARAGVPRTGWGQLAEVIRRDRPLEVSAAETRAFHGHLARAGAPAARELAPLLDARSLLDLGGGAGTYTAAYLDAHPGASATLVDTADVVALAAGELERFGPRVRLVAGDARAPVCGAHGAALLANVLHGHPPAVGAELCAAAARAIVPGGVVAIKELRVDDGRTGPLSGLLFALNMALYTDGGDVYETAQLRAWLAAAGLVEIEERRLASSPDAIVVIGRRPRGAGAAFVEVAGLAAEAAVIADELERALAHAATDAGRELASTGALRPGAAPPAPSWPAPLRQVLAHAIALERAERTVAGTERSTQLIRHYTDLMPRARIVQLASSAEPTATLFHTPLAWDRLPRLAATLDRLFAILDAAGADPTRALGAPTAAAFRARTPTLAALYARTHYGGSMPLLYGNLADLAYFIGRGEAARADLHPTIDRYLTTPLVHELCHFAPDRDALHPLHLDECVAGWLGVHVHPEFAYPRPGEDDAIFAAPWLSQIGQAIARAFGTGPVIRAHAGTVAWDAAVPRAFVDAAARLGWDDWRARRTIHFLSNTLDPAPWVALALVAGAGRSLAGLTLAQLAATPLATLAAELPDDPAFDLAIVADALRAMCLDNVRIDGSFRARTKLPEAPITIDALTCRVASARRGEVDTLAPSYWLPPAVAARLAAHRLAGYELRLEALAAIPDAAAAICAASTGLDREGVVLVARR